MKVTVERTKIFTLSLDEKEAKLLKGFVQNPICEDEGREASNMRQKIWDALTDEETETTCQK